MKIACEACGAKYTIADDKVRGRKVKIRCKGCGTPIVVDGQHGGGPSISDAETDAALEPAEAPVIWSVNLSDTDSRTMSVEEIVEGYASGLVTADAFVWKDGMGDWVPLLESELAPHLGSPPAAVAAPVLAASAPLAASPLAPTATPLPGPGPGARGGTPLFAGPQGAQVSRPAATTRASQPDNTQDLFGSLDTAGAEEEVATSAPIIPQAGSSAYDDGKMTGARNENSVLFSLDALKAGFSPSASSNAAKPAPKAPGKAGAPGAARPQQPSNPDDPFGMGAGNGLMGIGGSSGVLFGADNQALLTAPAAPPPPPAPTPAQIAAGAMPAPAAPANNKLVYIVGGIGGVVIIGLLAVLLLGKKADTTATADSAMPSASAAPVAIADKPAEEAKKDEPKPSDAPSASVAPSASAAPSASEAKPADKPVAVAQSGGTAAKKPAEPAAAPAGDAPPFSKASAISALGAAASGAGSCKKAGGPTGAGKATVTFAPSGRVTTATVAGGSYAGTAVGGCVASVFRRAHVPAFSGSSVTVSKSFQIN
jgi:predicted Zn finger-like uncharacterized protein